MSIYEQGDRIELHPATNLWMRGARYGSIVGTRGNRVIVRLDKVKRNVSVALEDFTFLTEQGK